MTVAESLAEWATSLRLEDVPADVRYSATGLMIDALGTALAARRLRVVEPAVAVARGLAGPPEASVLGSATRLGACAAAFANGALVHGLDFDDTHALGMVHASAVVLPAALAVGEQTNASGADVLTAAIAGYEAVCRVGMASPHGFHARGLHATAVAGVFAAAVVAARLLDLDAAVLAQALGIAGSGASGLLEFLSTGSSTKQLHPGSASMNGILAARLAAAGATGPVSVFEGPRGLYATMADREVDLDAITRELGSTWQVADVGIKPYPACQLMHATLDAVAAITEPVDPSEVVEIVAGVHADASPIVCEPAERKVHPRTPYDAKFSLQWSVAALLADGCLNVDSYTAESVARPEIAALAGLVRTGPVGGGGSTADAPGNVLVRLRSGATLTGAVRRSNGGPLAPLSDEQVHAKFAANCAGSAAATELGRRVRGLADEPDLRAVIDLCAQVIGADE